MTYIIGAALGLLTAILGVLKELPRRDQARARRIETALTLWGGFPDNSPARGQLLKYAEELAAEYTVADARRREPLGVVVASMMYVAVGFLGAAIWSNGGLWWWLAPVAIFLFTLASVGWSQDGVRRLRDERGRPLKK